MIIIIRIFDVLSGGVFSVKMRICFMWVGLELIKVLVIIVVEWIGKSWIKGWCIIYFKIFMIFY